MAAWLESERANIRHYLGFPAIFVQADLRVETAITSVLAISDGGTRPDNSTQVQIQGWLSDLATVDLTLKSMWSAAVAGAVGNIKIDVARGVATMRGEGRRLVNNISRALGTDKKVDIYSSGRANRNGPPFPEIYGGDDPNVRW